MSARPMPELSRRAKEQELLRAVQKAQNAFHAGKPEDRAAALEKYLEAVTRFSEFVLGRQPRADL